MGFFLSIDKKFQIAFFLFTTIVQLILLISLYCIFDTANDFIFVR